MSTPEGFYAIEGFGLVVPIVMILVTVVVGSRALAGGEGNRTMGLLLANPVKRSTVVLEKTVALVIITAVLGLVAFGGTLLGSAIGGLDMQVGNIAAICLLAALLGLVIGELAPPAERRHGQGTLGRGGLARIRTSRLAAQLLPAAQRQRGPIHAGVPLLLLPGQ
jgi:ABC-2 type transport system permease protein